MRVLLSDGSGLASRQTATILARAGHEVEILATESLPLARLTRHVRSLHRVPAYGLDPWGWFDAALQVLRRRPFDVLLPTQEQVALLAREAATVRELGVGMAVPPWHSLLRVQDKAAAYATLAELDLPQPRTVVVDSAEALAAVEDLPVFVKAPVGTASSSVVRVETRSELEAAARAVGGAAVVQWPAAGPLVMVQAVFREGELLAWHANLRVREGLSGGASHKLSAQPAGVEGHLERLGGALGWHGALSLDAILEGGQPLYIDVNPRLVEPGNAFFAGLDLPDLMLRVSLGSAERPPASLEGVRTHQFVLAVLGAAAGGGRRGVAREIASALGRRSLYRNSHEELTPVRGDPLAAAALVGLSGALLIHPGLSATLSSGAVSAYALTPEAWEAIRAGRNRG
jgi:ATP-grasp domain-containing protein